jgi:large subunit ribosomal protein L30
MARRLRIRRVRSLSGRDRDQRATAEALGLRRLHQVVEHRDTPQIRGMIFKIRHLVEVEEG